MEAAPKTVEFVKQWIAGTYTKRQYQNYYIVKTQHAEFLLKKTEQRDLLAIKDHTGHIFIFDDELSVYTYGTPPYVDRNAGMNNPLLCLIRDNHAFQYSRITPNAFDRATENRGELSNQVSKWRTIDRMEIKNTHLLSPMFLSLVEIGEQRFIIDPFSSLDATNPISTSLSDWVMYIPERTKLVPNPWFAYTMSKLYSNKLDKVKDIRNSYLTGNEEVDSRSKVVDNWVIVPTEYECVTDITGPEIKEAKKLRPNPYAYGLSGSNSSFSAIYNRYETLMEAPEKTLGCFNIKNESASLDTWESSIRSKYTADLAEDVIDFIKKDDEWLSSYAHIAKAGDTQARFLSKVSLPAGMSLAHIANTPNTSPLDEYIIYAQIMPPTAADMLLQRLIPAPNRVSRIKGILNDNH